MATLESTWNLGCNSAPRSIAIHIAPQIPIPSISPTRGGVSGGGGGASSSNPFDTTSSGRHPNRSNNNNNNTANPFNAASNQRDGVGPIPSSSSLSSTSSSMIPMSTTTATTTPMMMAEYAVLIGTERGSLHYRTFPSSSSSSTSYQSSSPSHLSGGTTGGGGGYYNNSMNRNSTPIHPLGMMGGISSGLAGEGGGVSISSSSNVHPLHQPLDSSDGSSTTTTNTVKHTVVACVRASYPLHSTSSTPKEEDDDGAGAVDNSLYTSSTILPSSSSLPPYLVLRDDHRGVSSGSSSIAEHSRDGGGGGSGGLVGVSGIGAYAASIITLNLDTTTGGSGDKNPYSTNHTNGGGYDHNTKRHTTTTNKNNRNLNNTNTTTNSTSSSAGRTISTLVESTSLPRMSCVAFHPNCGFVYASGTSVMSLSPVVIRTIARAAGGAAGGGTNSTTTSGSTGVSGGAGGGGGKGMKSFPHNPFGSTTTNIPTPNNTTIPTITPSHYYPTIYYEGTNILPSRLGGVRSGLDSAMAVVCNGFAVVVAVGNGFYCVSGAVCPNGFWQHNTNTTSSTIGMDASSGKEGGGGKKHEVEKVLTFAQSSQVHPAIVVDIPVSPPSVDTTTTNSSTATGGGGSTFRGVEDDGSTSSLIFLASGRECAVVEITYHPQTQAFGASSGGRSLSVGPPRHGIATLTSPILAAVGLIPSSPPPSASQVQRTNRRRGHNQQQQQQPETNTTQRHQPLVAVLTSDGLIHTRSPSCISIPLSTIEVGTRPNDFFTLRALPSKQLLAASYSGEGRLLTFRSDTIQDVADRLMKLSIDAFGAGGFPRPELADAVVASFSATSYVGPEPTVGARDVLRQYLETILGLDTGDFGGICRGDMCRWLLDDDNDNDNNDARIGADADGIDNENTNTASSATQHHRDLSSSSTATFLSSTALLCLICTHITQNPQNAASLANRAAKSCATKIGVVNHHHLSGMKPSAVRVCELIAERLLQEAEATNRTLLSSVAASHNPIRSSRHNAVSCKGGIRMEMVEASVWLLRSCGLHERAIEVLQERMENPVVRNKFIGGGGGGSASSAEISEQQQQQLSASPSMLQTSKGTTANAGGWTQIKYDTHTASHLGELWSLGDESCCNLVLASTATRKLLERNPRLGSSIFNTPHPQNERQWITRVVVESRDDPLARPEFPMKVVDLLKSICPIVTHNSYGSIDDGQDGIVDDVRNLTLENAQEHKDGKDGDIDLPLESGRALAVMYLESAIGISSGRPSQIATTATTTTPTSAADDKRFEDRVSELHDELAYLLLEGVISERSDDDAEVDSDLGQLYRGKLRRLLAWPNAKIRSERLMASLPSSFLRERALLLGRLGRHEDALRIFYFDLKSLDLALEYCDTRSERQRGELEHTKRKEMMMISNNNSDGAGSTSAQKGVMRMSSSGGNTDCAYLPLISVALESDQDSVRGIATAIQVLSLRREAIDRASALRLLPQSVPMSSISRPFLIPALVDSESQVRRLTIASSLLRAKYVRLKHSLTEAQIKSQSTLHAVPALRSLNLGDPVYTSKPFKARPSTTGISHFPDVTIYKHFFPRYVVIQAKVNNSAPSLEGRTLGDVSLVVAESSDEALLPSIDVAIKTLPFRTTGSSWCVLAASPQRLDGTAILACEVRYTVLAVDSATGAPLSFSSGFASVGSGRAFVEEVQDIEVHHAEFNG